MSMHIKYLQQTTIYCLRKHSFDITFCSWTLFYQVTTYSNVISMYKWMEITVQMYSKQDGIVVHDNTDGNATNDNILSNKNIISLIIFQDGLTD